MSSKRKQPQIRTIGTGATEHAINTLTEAILDGSYQAGDRLVENRLTVELGVSRGSVREALRRLDADGLIELELNRGAIVRSIGRRDVIEILTIREVLEGLATSLAAQNIDKDDNRQQAIAMLHEVEQVISSETKVDFQQDNASFHQFIIGLSANDTLARQIEQLQKPAIRSWFFNHLKESNWQRSLNEHKMILEAILDSDAALAEQLMCAHIRRVRKVLEGLPEDLFENNKGNAFSAAQSSTVSQN